MEKNQKKGKNSFDGIAKIGRQPEFYDLPLAQYALKYKKSSILFHKRGKIDLLPSREANRYFPYGEKREYQVGKANFRIISLDSIKRRNLEKTHTYSYYPSFQFKKGYWKVENYFSDLFGGSLRGLSAVRMWNLSIVGAVIFGMFTMTMIYRYLGQNVSAKMQGDAAKSNAAYESEANSNAGEDINKDIDVSFMTKLIADYDEFERTGERMRLEDNIREMVKGYPIEKMVPEISKRDRIVAAFIVGIAKKESDWGKHVPVLNGGDCYNYWGYKGLRKRMGTGGHTCFDSPEDAVSTVAKRIEFLVSNEKLNTPAKMKIWKCGYDCSWDNPGDVQKWIDDVSIYFKKLNK